LRDFAHRTVTKAQIREQRQALGILVDLPQQAAIEVVNGLVDPDISSYDLEQVQADIAEQAARLSRLMGVMVEQQQIQDAIDIEIRKRRDEEQAVMLVLTAYHAWQ
jgi:nucleotide-binding universal stress UspA family protein